MKALLLSQYRHLEIANLPRPTPGSGEVLIQVAACGICGSDVHGYDGSSGRRIPPIVMGHEAAGTVAERGAGVKNVGMGDRVTFDSTIFCGSCPYCVRGKINLCDSRQVLGVSCADYRRAGAFAEYVAVPDRVVHRLPANLPFAEAAMLEAVAVALHAAEFSSRASLVNNAGCNVRKPAVEVTWDDWNLILDTNLRSSFFVAQSVARGMISRGYGRISTSVR